MFFLMKNNVILNAVPRIDFGEFDEPGIKKWALMDENDVLLFYILDDGYHAMAYTGDPSNLPEDIAKISGKYTYDGTAIRINPDYYNNSNLEARVDELEVLIDDLLTNILPALMA